MSRFCHQLWLKELEEKAPERRRPSKTPWLVRCVKYDHVVLRPGLCLGIFTVADDCGFHRRLLHAREEEHPPSLQVKLGG